MRTFLYVLLAYVLILSVLQAVQFVQINRGRAEGRANLCHKMDTLNATFTGLIRAGEKQLPTLAYYRSHPAELRRAVATDEQDISQLTAAITCK